MPGIGLELVRSLEEDWQATLDGVAKSRGWPTSRDVAKLAGQVSGLSAAYNDPACARAAMRDAGAARLGFAFARDVPKGAAAVRELIATGGLANDPIARSDRTLRVLDLGAGLGAMTWGLVRALEAANRGPCIVEASWIDADPAALDVGMAILRAREGRGTVELRVRPIVRRLAEPAESLENLGPFDVVLLGNLLSELGVSDPDAVRVERHVGLLRGLLDVCVGSRGAIAVVEPALRDRTRHLHRVRDGLARSGVSIFAPCLHEAPCPALERETDWCHEDVAVDLPEWLIPVARRAGLRHEGLTFSYLVLRKDGARLADWAVAGPGAARLRVVSDVMRSKGKREVFLCGEFSGSSGPTCGRARVMRLDREAARDNETFAELRRGAVVVIDPAPDLERARVGSANSVRETSGPVPRVTRESLIESR
jgi:hypothetical protein